MSQLRELMQLHPGFGFSTQYVLARGDWNTYLAFHNYFEEVFPGQNVAVELHLVFHDGDGREVLYHRIEVDAGDAIQIDCRALGVHDDGLIAMSAVALKELTVLADGKFTVKHPVTTGFYITWERANRWRDTMHEWAPVSSRLPARGVQHVGFAAAAEPLDCGLVLTNPTTAASPGRADELRLRTTQGGYRPVTATMAPLPPMGSRVLRLTDHFADFNALLAAHGRVLVDVTSQQAAPPLTAEWHQCGDFHLHHI